MITLLGVLLGAGICLVFSIMGALLGYEVAMTRMENRQAERRQA